MGWITGKPRRSSWRTQQRLLPESSALHMFADLGMFCQSKILSWEAERFFPLLNSEIEMWISLEGLVFHLVGKGACYKIEPLKVILFLFCFILFLRCNLTKQCCMAQDLECRPV